MLAGWKKNEAIWYNKNWVVNWPDGMHDVACASLHDFRNEICTWQYKLVTPIIWKLLHCCNLAFTTNYLNLRLSLVWIPSYHLTLLWSVIEERGSKWLCWSVLWFRVQVQSPPTSCEGQKPILDELPTSGKQNKVQICLVVILRWRAKSNHLQVRTCFSATEPPVCMRLHNTRLQTD